MRLTEHQSRHRDDVERIMRVTLQATYMRAVSFFEAYAFWTQHSEMYAAGWLNLPESDEELRAILQNGNWSIES